MEQLADLMWLVPLLPLLGFTFLVAFGRRLGEPIAGWIATLAMAGSFAAAVLVFIGLQARDEADRFAQLTLFDWVPAGDFNVSMGFLADPLSVTMILFITGIATLIHLYSIGYMHGDPNFSKFFVYLNLFAFSMLMRARTSSSRSGSPTKRTPRPARRPSSPTASVTSASCWRRSCASSSSVRSPTARCSQLRPGHWRRLPHRRSCSCCWSAPPVSPRSSPSTCGCPMRWPAQRQCRR